jgi:carbamoyl-phosphate synthase small subunit
MNAVISSEETDIKKLKAILSQSPFHERGWSSLPRSVPKSLISLGEETATYRVAVLDFGVKRNILRNLTNRDCYLQVFPARTSFETIQAWEPHAYFLSNGPGDPEPMDYATKTVQAILDTNKPVFGICLGHQILAKSVGISTYKMHNGHRGINHPVINLATGKSEITSQNHGFGVSPEAIEAASDIVEITHRNLNDDTIEGIKIIGKPAFSVQYHPEASPGPHDSNYLFDNFLELIKSQ